MKKLFTILLALTLSFGFGCGGSKQKDIGAKISMSKGNVSVLWQSEGTQKEKIAQIGDIVYAGSYIITGTNSKVQLILPERGIVQIGPNSQVEFASMFKQETNNFYHIGVLAGKMSLALKKLEKDSVFEVETPTAVAGVRGTSFMVNVQDNRHATIAVLTGEVELSAGEKRASITALKRATIVGRMEMVKIENIDRLSLDEMAEITSMAVIKQLSMSEIEEEIAGVEPQIRSIVDAKLKLKSEIKRITPTTIEENTIGSIKMKDSQIEKVKTKQKREGKYLDDNSSW